DSGGRTGRGGITHTTYDAYRSSKGLPLQDVFKISDAEITEIYATNYWAPIYGDRLPAGQDLALFDYAINSGPAKANEARMLAGDGDVPTLIHKICASRLSFMHSLGSWGQFGAVWGRRVAQCEALALHMAGSLTPATVDAAAQAKDAQKKNAARVVTGGVVAAGAASHFANACHWALIAILGIAGVGAAIAIFNAWRQGQRTDALTSAVQQMQTAQATAAAASAAVAKQVSDKEAAIAAEQASLNAAKAAINRALSGSPLPVSPVATAAPASAAIPAAPPPLAASVAAPPPPPAPAAPAAPAPIPATK
ncbi:MAG: glycosyl hydrolase 108 family protein, partial [Methylocella sp.]